MTIVDWHDLKAQELRALAESAAIVIVPVGSTEQHGPHLPVQVDALLATEVARRTARILVAERAAVVAPTVWLGLAEHHMSFGGTITLDFATFHALLRCICRSILRHGFRHVLLLNGHGGNVMALNVIVGELRHELDAEIAAATYWTLPEAAGAMAEILDEQKGVRHACEAETSMLLALKPDLVDREAMATVEAPMDGLGAHRGIYRWRQIADYTASGVIGAPASASAEKGERLLDAAATALARVLGGGEVWAAPT